MNRWTYAACLAVLLAMSAGSANAASYTMGDHPDGTQSARGDYGVRLDGVWNSLFSIAGATLTWDGGATAKITGVVSLSDSSNAGSPDGDLWTLEYTITGLSAYQGGFKATGGYGTMVDQTPGDNDAYFDYIALAGKQDAAGYAFYFAPNGFRLCNSTGGSIAVGCYASFNSSDWVGNGWVMGEYTKLVDGRKKTKSFGSRGSNDFLFTAKSDGDIPDVPEPSTMLLTMGGVALLWFRKRRS